MLASRVNGARPRTISEISPRFDVSIELSSGSFNGAISHRGRIIAAGSVTNEHTRAHARALNYPVYLK